MEPDEARPGVRVMVSRDHRKPELRELTGTILRQYGDPARPALDVRLENGRVELFWYYQLEKAGRVRLGTLPHSIFNRER
jgi:hypothetical protein